MIEEIVFFLLISFCLFMIIFPKIFSKTDDNYLPLLLLQALGILICFIEIILRKHAGVLVTFLRYIFSVIIPIIVIYLEKKGHSFEDICLSRISQVLLYDWQ